MLLFFYTKTIKHKKVKKKRDLAHKFEHCYLQYKGLCRILKSLKTSAIFNFAFRVVPQWGTFFCFIFSRSIKKCGQKTLDFLTALLK